MKQLTSQDQSLNQNYNVLSLSGGGFRGLFSVLILNEIEQHLNKPLARCFDIISGTSIGGILALALALEIPTSKLLDAFIFQGKDIFKPRWNNRFQLLSSFIFSRYTNDGLKKILQKNFGKAKIGDLKHRVIIPAVDMVTGKGRMFKTPHKPGLIVDKKISLIDVALATSAAPSFFPPHQIDGRTYIDGAIVGNDPALFAVQEIKHFIHPSQEPNIASRKCNIRVLSIGTMEPQSGLVLQKGDIDKTGLIYWFFRIGGKTPRLLEIMFSAQRYSTYFQLKQMLGENYVRIDSTPSDDQIKYIGLDRNDEIAKQILRGYGKSEAQSFLGSKEFEMFMEHIPTGAVWFTS